jgi:hypothetical protein
MQRASSFPSGVSQRLIAIACGGMTGLMQKLALVVVLGSAAASSAPTAKPKQTLSFGTPTVSGALDAKVLAVVVKKSTTQLLACYAKAPQAQIDATVAFTIGKDGTVATAEVMDVGQDIEACITATFLKIKFAASKETTGVVYRLTFTRTVDDGHGGMLGSNPFGDFSGGSDLDANIYGGLVGTQDDLRGFPTDSGTGWGTIGHGSGTSSSYGVVPLISLGEANTSGDLDKAIIRRYIKRNLMKLQYCYEKELLANKTLQGTVTVAFTIGAQGSVATSTASGMKNKNVESCVASVIHDIEFPKPHDGNEVTVTYPFTFKPPPTKKTK